MLHEAHSSRSMQKSNNSKQALSPADGKCPPINWLPQNGGPLCGLSLCLRWNSAFLEKFLERPPSSMKLNYIACWSAVDMCVPAQTTHYQSKRRAPASASSCGVCCDIWLSLSIVMYHTHDLVFLSATREGACRSSCS